MHSPILHFMLFYTKVKREVLFMLLLVRNDSCCIVTIIKQHTTRHMVTFLQILVEQLVSLCEILNISHAITVRLLTSLNVRRGFKLHTCKCQDMYNFIAFENVF